MRRIVILFGPPAAGKGTVAKSIVREFGLYWLSSGDLLRTEIQSGTGRGIEIARRIDVGNFVSDEMIIDLVLAEIETLPPDRDILLDGFPRSLLQARTLEAYANDHRAEVSLVIELAVDEQETRRRVIERSRIEGRADDTVETLERRWSHFRRQTQPLASYYRQLGRLETVDGMGASRGVVERIDPFIRQALRSDESGRQKEAG